MDIAKNVLLLDFFTDEERQGMLDGLLDLSEDELDDLNDQIVDYWNSALLIWKRYHKDILKLIVTLTANVMKAKICSLWLLDEKTRTLKIRATQAMSKEYLKERSIKLGEGIVGLVAREKKPIVF